MKKSKVTTTKDTQVIMILTLTIVLLTTGSSGEDTVLGKNLKQLYSIPASTTEDFKLVSNVQQQKSVSTEKSFESIKSDEQYDRQSDELNSLLNSPKAETSDNLQSVSSAEYNHSDSSNGGFPNQNLTSVTINQYEPSGDANQMKNFEGETLVVPLFTPTSDKSFAHPQVGVNTGRTILFKNPLYMKGFKRGFQNYVLVPKKRSGYVQVLRPRQRRRNGYGIKRNPVSLNRLQQKERDLNLTNDVASFLTLPPLGFFRPRGKVLYPINLPMRRMAKKNSELPVFEVARSIHKRKRYDVPQIECPPTSDGTERFACPTGDHMGRYKCILDHSMCDGFIDCPKGEDEDRRSCMFYQTTKAHLDVLADALLRWARGRY